MPVSTHWLVIVAVGEGVVQGQDGDAAGGEAKRRIS
jgi:hypothetical protein